MELQSFVEKVAEQFEETDANEFHAGTKFKDLKEWSSLLALSIIAMVDEEYDIKVKGDDIRNAVSIEDLYHTVKSRI
jgi:acyl carrier protein